jgi:hypothetical protein
MGKLRKTVNMNFRSGFFGRRLASIGLLTVVIATLSACNFDIGGEQKYPDQHRQTGDHGPVYGERQTVTGEGGLFSSGKTDDGTGGSGGIGVNNLLWRASLDTISFMPLVSADPFGGVIITDWYTPPATPDERFKVNVYILGRALRADGLRASVFRQQNQSGQWVDAPVALNTATDLENAILTKARELRSASKQ